MQRKFVFSIGEYYHIYNRGVEKRDLFLDNSDRDRFMRLLYVSNGTNPVALKDSRGRPLGDIQRGEQLVHIGAYCMMPNHFHILVKEIADGGITKFMSKLSTAYSMYFNKKSDRKGSLLEKPFRAKHADSDEYLKYLFSYIHLNPVKIVEPKWKETGISDASGAKQYLLGYKYSSYHDYVSNDKRDAPAHTIFAWPFVKI